MERQINIEDMMNSEKNKRIFVMAFARMNLGDDIFLKMLFERYPMHDFYMQIEDTDMLSPFSSFKNLHVMKGKDTDEELYKMNPDRMVDFKNDNGILDYLNTKEIKLKKIPYTGFLQD